MAGDHTASVLEMCFRKERRACDHSANAATIERRLPSVLLAAVSWVRSDFLPILLSLSAVASPPYCLAKALPVNVAPQASLGCTRGSHWLQSGSWKAIGTSRELRRPSGRKRSGVICPASSRRLDAPSGKLGTPLLASVSFWRSRYRNASGSCSRTQTSPAPAAQFEIGCASSPRP